MYSGSGQKNKYNFLGEVESYVKSMADNLLFAKSLEYSLEI